MVPSIHAGRRVRWVRTEKDAVERHGLALIGLAVIAQAAEDVQSDCDLHRAEARAFLQGEDLAPWCMVAGLQQGRVRAALLDGVE